MMLGDQEIVQRFLTNRRQVHPEVVRYLQAQNDPSLINQILASLPNDALVVSAHHIPGLRSERDGLRFLPEPELEVLRGGDGISTPSGNFGDFLHYFRDRFSRLGEIIRARAPAIPIQALSRNALYRQQQECTLIGMISDIRTTTHGHRLAEMEDPTGQIPVLFNKDRPVFSEAERIVPDEVIGVRGKLSNDGKIFFADTIIRPDIPLTHAPYQSEKPGKAVFISDIHVGSNTFMEREWGRFVEWLEQSNTQYLLIAGDLVDGIGVYPNQDSELVIKDIYDQYTSLGEMLSTLPRHLRIVLSPGNHDIVRGVEPQPTIPEPFRKSFPKNCIWVENPCLLSLQGVRVMMYHGRSIDDMIGLIPDASYAHPQQMMEEMLRRRHLALTYGKRVPLAAEKVDRLIIDPVPEVLHTGHVHTSGITTYRGVLGINAGAWQSQTAFQRQMNVHPTPGRAVLLDLQTLQPEVLDFTRPFSS